MSIRFSAWVVVSLGAAACAPSGQAAPAQPTPASIRADSVRETTVAPGVRHHFLWDVQGPWAVHVLEVSPSACGVDVRSVKAADRLAARATTSAMALQAEEQWKRPALAAINADFFSFDPPGVPIGGQVSDFETVHGSTERPVFGITADGAPFISVLRLDGRLTGQSGYAAPLTRVNTRPGADGVALFNRYIGAETPADTGAVELSVRLVGTAGHRGDTVRAVVLGLDTLAAGVPMPADGAVLSGRGAGASFLRHMLAPGDTVAWWIGWTPSPGRVREMVGGFPRLLADGEAVHDRDPAVRPPFGDSRHPRTAVGWRADGTLLLVTVDGRQPEHSDGMSLTELAALFRRLGATDAINLDGGGSTAMVVRGVVVNRPSDRDGERANANALVILGPGRDTQDELCTP